MARNWTHPQGQVIARLLIDAGACGDPTRNEDWPAFYDDEPDGPERSVTVYSTQGTSDGRDFVTGEAMSHRGIQVRVRAATPADAFDKADETHTLLSEGVENRTVTIDGTSYAIGAFTKISDPLTIGGGVRPGQTRRSVYVINATVAGGPA